MKKSFLIIALGFSLSLSPQIVAQPAEAEAFTQKLFKNLEHLEKTRDYQPWMSLFAPNGVMEVNTHYPEKDTLSYLLNKQDLTLLLEEIVSIPKRKVEREFIGEIDYDNWATDRRIKFVIDTRVEVKDKVTREAKATWILQLVDINGEWKLQRLTINEDLKEVYNSFCVCSLDEVPSHNRETIIISKILLPGGFFNYVEAHVFHFVPSDGGVFIDVDGHRFFWDQRKTVFLTEGEKLFSEEIGLADNRSQAVFVILGQFFHQDQCISIIPEPALEQRIIGE